ncbi:hypothetical protein BU23DRAFT_54850 [Bimuria novae-zelandiae CBS 107.79]|uniref:Uncharacterized protein n=1 Tax=Bimuria novae-zelandiae CBS 107.79 TaxID=1447943 RepID=A0A6A5UU52_9PLEO|nr:hypothetical protein BU23DRAFT_54850 [Bimuria novae-zelandiae CBS 107.79]
MCGSCIQRAPSSMGGCVDGGAETGMRRPGLTKEAAANDNPRHSSDAVLGRPVDTASEHARHVLTTQSSTTPTTLIICSGKDAFLLNLAGALQLQEGQDRTREKLLQLATPTLHNLFTARHVKIAFCASVQALLAYLTSFKPSEQSIISGQGELSPRLVLVNPLGLHAATSSFSAQGLSRAFAAAVETSLRIHAQLVVAECQGGAVQPPSSHGDDDGNEHVEGGEIRAREAPVVPDDPWEQDVSILNVSAKKFGDRAWAGRTVSIKRIAGRWFRFRKLDDPGT